MELHTIGIDLGKTVFHLVGLNRRGEVVDRKKLSRPQLLRFTANLHVQLIGMEACGGAHFLGRALREQGHDVRLIPAQYVKPYVKTNKSDYIDAEAICGSGGATEDAICADQNRSAVGSPVAASGARALGHATYGGDQPDSQLVAGARHHLAQGTMSSRSGIARDH